MPPHPEKSEIVFIDAQRPASYSHHSEQVRRHLQASQIGVRLARMPAEPGLKLPAAPEASCAAVRASMQGNRAADTGPERTLRSLLHGRGLRFRKHVRPVSELACRADTVFRGARVAVFVDGCFWRRCPDHGHVPHVNRAYWIPKLERNIRRDHRNNAALAAMGWEVIRVWEHENPVLVAERIAATVKARS